MKNCKNAEILQLLRTSLAGHFKCVTIHDMVLKLSCIHQYQGLVLHNIKALSLPDLDDLQSSSRLPERGGHCWSGERGTWGEGPGKCLPVKHQCLWWNLPCCQYVLFYTVKVRKIFLKGCVRTANFLCSLFEIWVNIFYHSKN